MQLVDLSRHLGAEMVIEAKWMELALSQLEPSIPHFPVFFEG
jgi:hypothetical protein